MGLNKRSKSIFRTKDNTPQYYDKRVSFLFYIAQGKRSRLYELALVVHFSHTFQGQGD